MLQVKSFCEDHEMKYTNFCTYHGVLCCPACVSSSGAHNQCSGMQPLNEVIKTAKSSSLIQTIEERLQSTRENLTEVINDRQSNIQILKCQREDIIKSIKGGSSKQHFGLPLD